MTCYTVGLIEIRNPIRYTGTAQHNTPKYLHKDHDHLRASLLLSEFCELLVVLVPREECLAYESHSVDSPCAPVQESPLQSSSNEKQDVTVVRCSKPTLQKDHDGWSTLCPSGPLPALEKSQRTSGESPITSSSLASHSSWSSASCSRKSHHCRTAEIRKLKPESTATHTAGTT